MNARTTLILGSLALALCQANISRAADATAGFSYPTADRVEFVEECINDYPDKGRFEMVHKCSCIIDTLAKHYSYDDYVDMSTAAKAFTISGERGNVVRDTKMGQSLNATWKKAMADAKEACFIQ